MKIEFEDGSYIEISKSGANVNVIIQAVEPNNKNKKVINSVELTTYQFIDLIKFD